MRIYARDQVCSFRFTRATWGAFSNFQPLAVPSRRRPVDIRHIRARLSGVQVPGAPRPPATHRRSADGEGGGGHRTHAGLGARPRLERRARRRHALGAAHKARGEPGRNRRGAGRDRRPAHRRGLDPRPLVGRRPVADRYEGRNVLGRLWMELRQQLRDRESRGTFRRLARPDPRRPPRWRRRFPGQHPERPPDDGCAMHATRAQRSRTQTPGVESGDRRARPGCREASAPLRFPASGARR